MVPQMILVQIQLESNEMSGELIMKCLGSPVGTHRALSWSIIYLQELLREYSPLLLQGLSVLLLLVPKEFIDGIWGIFGAESDNSWYIKGEKEEEIQEVLTSQSQSLNQYSSFVDDQKVRGSENDLTNLKSHGFDKYRYLSSSFLKRMDVDNVGVSKPKSKKKRGSQV